MLATVTDGPSSVLEQHLHKGSLSIVAEFLANAAHDAIAS
jgi:hypothetical protein